MNMSLVAILAIGALALGYATQKLGDVERLEVNGALTVATTSPIVSAADIEIVTPSVTVPGQTTTTRLVSPAPSIEENYLIVGSDNAERLEAGDAVLDGRDEEVANHLADTIMILRIRPSEGTASLLSIPRDLEVTIAGTTRQRKVNSAFNLDDPEARVRRLIDTIEENLDIDLQHYVEVDLAGFRRVIDALGGVAVCFDGPSRDLGSGLTVEAGGWVTLAGEQALAYVRSRKLEVQTIDGNWDNASPRADLDRIERQQAFVRETVSQTFSEVVSDPRLLISLLSIAADELVTSNTFGIVSDGSDLAVWFRDFTEENLDTMSLAVFDLPVTAARNNEWRLGMLSAAEQQLDVFRGIDFDDVVPKRVSVELRGPRAERATIRTGLDSVGFGPGPQSSTSDAGAETVISYGVGGHFAARLIGAYLDGPIEFMISQALSGNDVVVDIGTEPIAVRETPRALNTPVPEVEVPATSVVESVDTTTTTEQRYEFDCSQSQLAS